MNHPYKTETFINSPGTFFHSSRYPQIFVINLIISEAEIFLKSKLLQIIEAPCSKTSASSVESLQGIFDCK
ncbi:MAG: hypothetical protein KAQ71_13050, partial [Desulfobulbaceae bacterium]|nr:hypothetical protein [Desulfobulbaceae bacterium]